jgi:hypothetical protein
MSWLNPICKADHEAVQPIVYLGKLRVTQLISTFTALKEPKLSFRTGLRHTGTPRRQSIWRPGQVYNPAPIQSDML